MTGLDAAVAQYVSQDKRYDAFFKHVSDLCATLLPAYLEEGKSHLTIAFGCSGGRHRSVALTEATSHVLALEGWQVSCRHRELQREFGSAE